jgi:hypothetical protein
MGWEEIHEGIRIREECGRGGGSFNSGREKLQGWLCSALRIQASIADMKARCAERLQASVAAF